MRRQKNTSGHDKIIRRKFKMKHAPNEDRSTRRDVSIPGVFTSSNNLQPNRFEGINFSKVKNTIDIQVPKKKILIIADLQFVLID